MLYLLGGSPRAGKSTMAKQFTSETGIPCFELDYLKMGIARGMPEYGLDPNGGDRIIAEQLWPVVKGMAMTYVENSEDCLLEGTYLLPEYVVELQQMYGDETRACFVGYTQIDTWNKVRQLRDYGVLSGDWDLSSGNDEEARQKVEFLKQFSMYIKAECDRYGLMYFENSSDHWKTIDEVVRFLGGPLLHRDRDIGSQRTST
jgi:putative acetyltransferase